MNVTHVGFVPVQLQRTDSHTCREAVIASANRMFNLLTCAPFITTYLPLTSAAAHSVPTSTPSIGGDGGGSSVSPMTTTKMMPILKDQMRRQMETRRTLTGSRTTTEMAKEVPLDRHSREELCAVDITRTGTTSGVWTSMTRSRLPSKCERHNRKYINFMFYRTRNINQP